MDELKEKLKPFVDRTNKPGYREIAYGGRGYGVELERDPASPWAFLHKSFTIFRIT